MDKEGQNFKPSLLKGFFAKESRALSWLMVMNHLTDGSLLELTQRYRRTGDWRWKSRLLCITPACQLNGTGKEAGDILGLTGIAMADFDHINPARTEEVRTAVNADTHTFMSYVTVSGDGLRVLFRYEGGDYASAFLAGNCHYADLIGMPFDEKCSNANRLSALCHDPKAYFNKDAEPFVPQPVEAAAPNASVPQRDPVAYAVSVTERHGEAYTQGNRHTYLMKCICMMNRLGVSQTEAERWALAHDLGEREIRTLCKSVYSLYASQHGTYTMPEHGCRNMDNERKVGVVGVVGVTNCFSHTRAHIEDDYNEDLDSVPDGETENDGSDPVVALPVFNQSVKWPWHLQQFIDKGRTAAQRDILLLGALDVFGATLNRKVTTLYDGKPLSPCLMLFVVAPPASGKGALAWLRHIVKPYHDELRTAFERQMKDYKVKKMKFVATGKAKAYLLKEEIPQPPVRKFFIIPGNNSGTGIQANIINSDGIGIIFQTEADTLSSALNADYGHFDDALRNAFDHEGLFFYRRTGNETLEKDEVFLSILLSGTPDQVKKLIESYDNGLASRFCWYYMPPVRKWQSQFDRKEDIGKWALAQGYEWKKTVDSHKHVANFSFELTAVQKEAFDSTMQGIFARGQKAIGIESVSSIIRIGPQLLRIMEVVAFLRCSERGEGFCPAPDIPADNVKDGIVSRYVFGIGDEDFANCLDMAEVMFRHAMHVLSLLPAVSITNRGTSDKEAVFSAMGQKFQRKDFIAKADELGIPANTAQQWLKNAIKRRQICRSEYGCYEFVNPA